jgi:L-aspartate semialdehyde sulfurtransferase ferredoxin
MKRYILRYPAESTNSPILSEAILKTGVLVNILTSDVEYSKEMLAIAVVGPVGDDRRLVKYLRGRGVGVEELTGGIEKDEDRCVDCCACFGVCPTKAITIEERRMRFDNGECIRCGACVEACPTRALRLKDA